MSKYKNICVKILVSILALSSGGKALAITDTKEQAYSVSSPSAKQELEARISKIQASVAKLQKEEPASLSTKFHLTQWYNWNNWNNWRDWNNQWGNWGNWGNF